MNKMAQECKNEIVLQNLYRSHFPNILIKTNVHSIGSAKDQVWRNQGGRGVHAPPPDFGRSENGGGSTGALHYYSPPQIFRPSAIPED